MLSCRLCQRFSTCSLVQEDEDVQLERRGDLLAPLKVLTASLLQQALQVVSTLDSTWAYPGQQVDKEAVGGCACRVPWHGHL